MVLSMDRWIGKVAVVTGASSGIGAAIAEQLVENGLKNTKPTLVSYLGKVRKNNSRGVQTHYIGFEDVHKVAGLARRQDRLEQLANKLTGKKGKLFPIKTDLTKEEDILQAFKWIKEHLDPVHILINNAGTAHMGPLLDGDTETWNNIFQLNVIGLSIATREAVKDMRVNNVDGHIIHINSTAGHQVTNIPANVYFASKFAVRALAETLRLELNSLKLKIKITNLSPGLVDTELVPPGYQKRLKELFEANKIIEAENIADGVIYALSTPPHVQIQQLTIRPILNHS